MVIPLKNSVEPISPATLRIYIFLLKKSNPIKLSRSDIAKKLNLNKSTVQYHLDKLKHMGLIEETSEGIIVKELIPVGTLKAYIAIMGKLVPRNLFYATFFLTALLITILGNLHTPTELRIIAITISLIGASFSIYEIWKLKL